MSGAQPAQHRLARQGRIRTTQLPDPHFTTTQETEWGMGRGTTGPIKIVASASEIVLGFRGLLLVQLPLLWRAHEDM